MRLRVLALLALALLAGPHRAAAATFVVNSSDEVHDAMPGDGKCETFPGNQICTLRAAVDEANTSNGNIIQVPGMSFTLAFGELVIQKPMTISGAGMYKTVISANNASRVFRDAVDTANVYVTDMTIRDGLSATVGGLIESSSQAYLHLERCYLTHGYAPTGGCIHGHVLYLTDSLVTDCHATGGDGGGVLLFLRGEITGSTISGNTSSGAGGGIGETYGDVFLTNSTVSGNIAGGPGGGIYGALFLKNVTVAQNVTDSYYGGGGVYNPYSAAAATVVNSVFAGNLAADNPHPIHGLVEQECAGALTNDGYTLMLNGGVTFCTISGTPMTFVASALIGPLQDNGGPAPTHALLAGSLAIDAGDPAGCVGGAGTLTVDQRGVHRPISSRCDAGAYERSPCGDVNGDGSVDVSDVFALINALFAGGGAPPGLTDVDQDGATSVSDVFYLINFLFAGGPAPVCLGA
jgi:hypothetical protein